MSQATIRTDIYNVVAAVANVGKVYDRARLNTTWDVFLDQFKTTISGQSVIRGWMVTYAGMPAATYTTFTTEQVTHRFLIRGILQLDDSEASEKTAAALVETVRNALEDDITLQDATDTRFHSDPVIVPVFEERVFGDVLCHYAEIEIRITENR